MWGLPSAPELFWRVFVIIFIDVALQPYLVRFPTSLSKAIR